MEAGPQTRFQTWLKSDNTNYDDSRLQPLMFILYVAQSKCVQDECSAEQHNIQFNTLC